VLADGPQRAGTHLGDCTSAKETARSLDRVSSPISPVTASQPPEDRHQDARKSRDGPRSAATLLSGNSTLPRSPREQQGADTAENHNG
jgi:hypothetical protein